MSEPRKILSGKFYDSGDPESLAQWHQAKDLIRDYNQCDSNDLKTKEMILTKLMSDKGHNLWIVPPFYVDYGNNCWIGGFVIIMPGVKISDNIVIGVGSIVTKDIPSIVIVYGSPCHVAKKNK